MLTLLQIFKAFQIGTFAYIFSAELIKPKHLLHFWFVWLEKLEKKHPKIAYPIGYCEKCFAGQIALWYFLFFENFNLINMVLFISFTILTPIILKKLFYVKSDVVLKTYVKKTDVKKAMKELDKSIKKASPNLSKIKDVDNTYKNKDNFLDNPPNYL